MSSSNRRNDKGSITEQLYEQLQYYFFNDSQASVFESIVRILSETLRLKHCMVGIFNPAGNQLDVRAISTHGELSPVFSYNLDGTPCEDVFNKGRMIIKDAVDVLYPKDIWLTENEVKSYIGVPLYDAENKPIGHLVVMDDEAILDEEPILPALEICSARLTVELIKELKENEIRDSERKYRHLFQYSKDAMLIFDYQKRLYVDCNEAACELFGFQRRELQDLKMEMLVPENSYDQTLTQIRSAIKSIEQGTPYINLGRSQRKKLDQTVFDAEVSVAKIQLDSHELLVTIRATSSLADVGDEEQKHQDTP